VGCREYSLSVEKQYACAVKRARHHADHAVVAAANEGAAASFGVGGDGGNQGGLLKSVMQVLDSRGFTGI